MKPNNLDQLRSEKSVAPIFKDLTEAEIIALMGQIFELPQVQILLRKREVKPDGPVSFDVRQIKRSAGQSAIACAAYRFGQKQQREYLLDENGQRIAHEIKR